MEASSNYSLFHFAGKPRMVVAKTLKEYEDILVPCGFFRVHQSHLVNLKYVEYFHPAPDEHVVLTNGEKVEVSRRRKAEFWSGWRGDSLHVEVRRITNCSTTSVF